jgi:hypothetical protein
MMSVVEPSASNLDIKRGILRTQIFWQLTIQFLLMQPTPWRWTTSSAPWSPSSSYFTIRSIQILCTHHSNSEAQLEPGGLPTSPPYLLVTMFHGVSSVLPSAHITYLRDCSAPT